VSILVPIILAIALATSLYGQGRQIWHDDQTEQSDKSGKSDEDSSKDKSDKNEEKSSDKNKSGQKSKSGKSGKASSGSSKPRGEAGAERLEWADEAPCYQFGGTP
jgi:cytoskeletal protein RodZ